jgi:hypothetical protein
LACLKPDLLKDSIQMARWLEEHEELKEMLKGLFLESCDPRVEFILETYRSQQGRDGQGNFEFTELNSTGTNYF